ncbi:MAG: sodium-dependent transporter [Burkholderiales bacterium]|nr:sodium-dependent transporter [Burkholderiales bacterium]
MASRPALRRETWGSRGAFIVAAIGAAVGLGNIWRFSYVAGENGGATFLLVYLAAIFLLGAPLVIAEVAIGRHSKGDAVESYRVISRNPLWIAPGAFGVLSCFLIMTFYLVVAGWALKYFAGAATGGLWRRAAEEYGGYFEDFVADPWQPVFWQLLLALGAVVVVAAGVRAGIERLARVVTPLLALVVLALAIRGLTLPGGGPGLAFLFRPDWGLLATPDIYLAAIGQAFFSLSLGLGLYVTYGSYLGSEHRLPGAVTAVVAGDTLMAVLAGVAIFPAVFAFGLDPASGPQLVFITLPQVFLAMPAGEYVGALFFFLLAAAALSASISGVEVPTAYAMRRLRWPRRRAAVVVGAAIFVCGIPASLGFGLWSHVGWHGRGILESTDYFVSNALLPSGGLLTALLVGWRWSAPALKETALEGTGLGRLWIALLRFVIPSLIVAIFLRAVGLI